MIPTICHWAKSELMIAYHNQEWGVPLFDDQKLFEFLILEGAQAGLSWETVLKKRDRYREVFDQFDAQLIAGYDDVKVAQLLADPGIIRNRLKIAATIQNAQAFLTLQKEYGSFSNYLWGFVDGKSLINGWESHEQIPASTLVSDRLSKDLKKRGFKFVGSTICYAFMQATGMVNDHTKSCYRHKELS